MRILFVKTSSLGDVIHHCPAVTDVLRRDPTAFVDWVVEEPFAEIAALHPGVRRVLPVAVRRWRSRILSPAVWGEIAAFRRALAEQAYDCVIDTQGLFKSALISRWARGPRHGYAADSAREPWASRFYDVRHSVPRELHAVERNRRLSAAALGADLQGDCDYGLRAADALPFPMHKPYCVLLSMSSRADKLWPELHWAALARALSARGLQPVLPWGSEEERARCERIAQDAGGAFVPRRMRLGELAALLKRARAVAGVDTGLAHLAVALGVPAVGIYCSTAPALTGLYGTTPLANVGDAAGVPAVDAVLGALEAFL